ncbi:MAG TPA: ATP-binding protein [Desulfobacteraceae bacterium]|nr:ATP-binding protein [Desulfobacteraceae bacterium]
MTTISDFTLQVITADNPWLEGGDVQKWQARFLPECYIPRSVNFESGRRVCLVVGPRQAGKSTLIWKTMAESARPCLYINCEEPAVRQWLSSPASFLVDIDGLVEKNTPVFFDEIQFLQEAGLFLKGIVDRRTDHSFYATGSSAFDLESRTGESLAGRAHRHLLLPLSLEEVCFNIRGAPALSRKKVASRLERLLLYGGYPPVYTSQNPERELIGLVESFVIRDASDRLKIRHPAAFRKIMELCSSQIGSLCNFSEWAAIAGISNDSVREYAGILENTHIIRLIRPYVGGKRAEITSAPKAYFLDNGIRNQIFGGFTSYSGRPDRGAVLENFVFTELYKAINPLLNSIRFWRSKSGAEVDFVLEHRGIISGWEVKAGDAMGKITRSSRSFIDAYQPECFFVVNKTEHTKQTIGKTRIFFIRPEQVGGSISRCC